ncbi:MULTISPECIES: TAXI family TRAP transporter solute-binding subunit [Bradyrhizobium]|uniref:TAXI family TRAP transporter solute-binding subunit n=1 Tax=Bradyrhizobium elkanii TaxID=29448 RepID=UPI0004216E54|nr:TAXI family TRAP transporter solute-binding subunit [Bradyrhizobium elkanii]
MNMGIFIAIVEDRKTACRPHRKLVPRRLAMVVFLLLACMFHQAVPLIARTNAPEATPQIPPYPMQTMPRLAQAKRSPSTNTVGIVTGRPTGTDFAIAQDISTVLATGQETGPRGEVALRILPMVDKGGIQNVRDVLTLPGADMGITPKILLNRLRAGKELGDISKSLVYIAPLFYEELHILARPEIRTVADLAGTRVNLGEEDSGTDILARDILTRLGLKATEINVDQNAAVERMRNGDIAATMFITGKPARWLERYEHEDGFHLVPVPYTSSLEEDYLPATFTHQDYPNLIATDERIDTLAVGSVLITYNSPRASERYQRLETFVNAFFSRISEFESPARHPKWKEINVAAEWPGWTRFAPAERWLKQRRSTAPDADSRAEFERYLDRSGIVPSATERERLFQDFLRWWKGRDR